MSVPGSQISFILQTRGKACDGSGASEMRTNLQKAILVDTMFGSEVDFAKTTIQPIYVQTDSLACHVLNLRIAG